MANGIILCGLNGAGKSTMGRILAQKLHYHFIDIENLYFPAYDSDYPYANARSAQEVEALLSEQIAQYDKFILAAVRGNYGPQILSSFKCAIYIDVPKEVRMERIQNRSFQKFGSRMEPGGDLYEHEKSFFTFAGSRTERYVTQWLQSLNCPVIRIDGTLPAERNVELICARMDKVRWGY